MTVPKSLDKKGRREREEGMERRGEEREVRVRERGRSGRGKRCLGRSREEVAVRDKKELVVREKKGKGKHEMEKKY